MMFIAKRVLFVNSQISGKWRVPQILILLGSVFPHLAGLRVNSAIKLDCQPMLEAVEIEDAIPNGELAARFGAQPPAAQQVPGGFFSLGLAVAQFANALGWDAHRQSMTALARISWPVEVIGELTPHPSPDRPECRNSRAGSLLPAARPPARSRKGKRQLRDRTPRRLRRSHVISHSPRRAHGDRGEKCFVYTLSDLGDLRLEVFAWLRLRCAVALVSIFFAGREDSVPGAVAATLRRHVVRHSDWRIKSPLQSVPHFGCGSAAL
jgi:hypothetical protein